MITQLLRVLIKKVHSESQVKTLCNCILRNASRFALLSVSSHPTLSDSFNLPCICESDNFDWIFNESSDCRILSNSLIVSPILGLAVPPPTPSIVGDMDIASILICLENELGSPPDESWRIARIFLVVSSDIWEYEGAFLMSLGCGITWNSSRLDGITGVDNAVCCCCCCWSAAEQVDDDDDAEVEAAAAAANDVEAV